jgi:hypothetical protein
VPRRGACLAGLPRPRTGGTAQDCHRRVQTGPQRTAVGDRQGPPAGDRHGGWSGLYPHGRVAQTCNNCQCATCRIRAYGSGCFVCLLRTSSAAALSDDRRHFS